MKFHTTMFPWGRPPGILRRGDRLEHYEIVEPIASGGFGDVYEGFDLALKRSVAIKVLRPQHLTDRGLRARFVREAQLLAKVDSEHVVRVHFAGQQNDMAYMVMELVDGATLAWHMRTEEPLPISDALVIAARIANGVGAAHDLGIIHRDLKPDNVLVMPDLRVKVGDFGTARALNEAQSEKLIGTLAYMSPEHFKREVQLDERADIRSIGLILYLMLCGKQAYSHPPDMDLPEFIVRLTTEPPPNPTRYARYLVEYDYVLRVVSKAIHRDRERRYRTAHEFEAACLEAKAQLHREASPERAERVARLDARAQFLVADTAPLLMVRSQIPAIPLREPRLADARAPVPSVERQAVGRKANTISLSFVVLAIAFAMALTGAVAYVIKPRSPQNLSQAQFARAAIEPTSNNSKAALSASIQHPNVPSAQPASTISTVVSSQAAVEVAQPIATAITTQQTSPTPKLTPGLQGKEGSIASVSAGGPAKKPRTLVPMPASSPATTGNVLPAPPQGSPSSIAEGCDATKYRCTVF